MTKVWCPCIECEQNSNQRCKSKEIKLKFRDMLTVNEGRVQMWVCDQYVVSDQARQLTESFENFMNNIMKGGTNGKSVYDKE